MPLLQNDFLKRIAEEAAFITSHTTGASLQDLQQNIVLQRALMWSLEVMGRAAQHLEPTFRQKHATIDWQTLISTKERLAKEYSNFDLNFVFTACQPIPNLLIEIEKIVNTEENANKQ